MPVYFRGEVTGVRTGEYDRKRYVVLQFMEKAEDNSVKFLEVNMPDDADPAHYRVGQAIELPIRISAKDKKIYYRALSSGTQAPPRPGAKA
ncbi:MAG: hypothetical protein AB7U62_03115 [Pseudolabrys sp.]